jgi:hypothetical protein
MKMFSRLSLLLHLRPKTKRFFVKVSKIFSNLLEGSEELEVSPKAKSKVDERLSGRRGPPERPKF